MASFESNSSTSVSCIASSRCLFLIAFCSSRVASDAKISSSPASACASSRSAKCLRNSGFESAARICGFASASRTSSSCSAVMSFLFCSAAASTGSENALTSAFRVTSFRIRRSKVSLWMKRCTSVSATFTSFAESCLPT